MSVRAKFKVDSITRTRSHVVVGREENGKAIYGPGEVHTVELSPVYANGDPNHENTKFWDASPSGSIKLGTVNAAAAAQVELGKEYYIDFTPAE